MKNQAAIQKLLLTKFTENQARNPAYSLRAFSRKVGLSPATTSLILSGKRPVSRKLAEKICRALLLDPQAKSEILGLFPEKRWNKPAVQADAVDPAYLQLSADHFRMVSEWYYFAILSLMKTKDFRSDASWIADRLGLSVTEVVSALERLKRLEIVAEDSAGRLVRSAPAYRTSDDVANLSVRKSHFEGLELARQSLEHDPVEKRDFTSVTMAIHPERLPQAKVLIRKFQDELDGLLEEGDGATEVYRLGVHLFPLSGKRK